MAVIGQVLVQFVFRLTFGLALAMGVTSPRQVSSGYFRVNMWVLMGLNTLAALALYSARDPFTAWGPWPVVFGLAVGLAAASYVGAVLWLYEATRGARRGLWFVALVGLLAAILDLSAERTAHADRLLLGLADIATGGVVLGTTLAAMLLGHWYLNVPGMQLAPLRRLVAWMSGALVARMVVAGLGGWAVMHSHITPAPLLPTFLAFRWLTGIVGALVLARMTWLTLQVPNTQSATGILYASLVLVFLGELVSQLLSVDTLYPL